MLPRENRLSTTFEYNVVRKYGEKLENKFFYIYILDKKDYSGPTRFGIVVTNKYTKIAPKRNRVKRVFREVIKKRLDEIKPGYWVVIHPRKLAEANGYEEISTEFNKVLPETPLVR